MNSSADVQDSCDLKLVDPARVAAVNARMPAEGDVADTADVFGLLGDPRRLKLLVALLDGELCVCDLAAVTGMSESATSHALRLLRAHRVVSVRRDGRMAYYRLDDAHVRMLVDLAVAHTKHTDAVHPERHPERGPERDLAGQAG
jgi:ArsR family transcriptional regulator, lead/cadmium/zinc/bismuth-responsive transcriptional repressor